MFGKGKIISTTNFEKNYEFISLLGEGSYGKAYLYKSLIDKVNIN
jgi:hypothetical protein